MYTNFSWIFTFIIMAYFLLFLHWLSGPIVKGFIPAVSKKLFLILKSEEKKVLTYNSAQLKRKRIFPDLTSLKAMSFRPERERTKPGRKEGREKGREGVRQDWRKGGRE